MTKLTRLQKLTLMGRKVRAQRHEAKLLRDEMDGIKMKVAWTERVIDPLTTVIDNIEHVLVGCKKLARKQGYLKLDDETFGGLL